MLVCGCVLPSISYCVYCGAGFNHQKSLKIAPAPTKTLKYNLMFNIISRKNHTNNIKYMNSLICKNTLR